MNYNGFFSPNEFSAATDSENIQLAVDAASAEGLGRVVIPRMNRRTSSPRWVIDRAILLPDDMEIVLDNCTLVQADGCFDNIFRNRHFGTGICQHDIRIRGVGHALLDGGNPNGLCERNSCKDGNPHISVNNTILLQNIKRFSIENIYFANQRWWAINLIFAREGRLSNLDFDAKDNIPNQDGIDLRVGCRDIIIENITGQGGDDLIALSGFLGFERNRNLLVEGEPYDICNVTIRNVVGTSVTKAIVALRNHDGIKMHDIQIHGVYDTSDDAKGNRPYVAVRIGHKRYHHDRKSILGETSRITVSDIHAHSGNAVLLNMTLCDSVFRDIYCGPGARSGVSTVHTPLNGELQGGVQMKNILIDGVFSAPDRKSELPLVRLMPLEECDTAENVTVRNVFGECSISYPGGIAIEK